MTESREAPEADEGSIIPLLDELAVASFEAGLLTAAERALPNGVESDAGAALREWAEAERETARETLRRLRALVRGQGGQGPAA